MASRRRKHNYDTDFDPSDDYGYGSSGDGYYFADPGGNSALRAATRGNPRIYSCPTCKTRKVLTRRDKELGYQCDRCADQQERGGY